MPYPAYTKMTRQDALAIRAYLMTVEPVGEKVESNQLPFPLSIRFNMIFWNGLNFSSGPFEADPSKSAEWNRGHYLVDALGHTDDALRHWREAQRLNPKHVRLLQLIEELPHLFRTITVDNGTEFHGYEEIERATGVRFYFATPYHSWERGTNENTNGLIRQYLPKGLSMKNLTQSRCEEIAAILNHRPRKRLGFFTPLEQLHDLGLL